jgi:hypothetical protein
MPPTGQRGTGPVSPRDWTGRQFAQQQRAQMDKLKATRDIENEIKATYDKGHNAGWSEAVEYIWANFDVFEKEDGDEDTNIVGPELRIECN